MPSDLKGAVALITGGGSGIGQATARMLGERGARVAVTELPGRAELAQRVVAELHHRDVDAFALALDLRQTLTIPHAIDSVARHFGRLDILVNNAGKQLLKPALEIEEEEFDDIMNVNLKGAFMCSQAAASLMVKQGRGCIVNVASQHGVVGNRNRAPYCASKAGLINLTRALAIEWADAGIRVNSISPTFVVNETNRELIASGAVADEIASSVPMRRPATPDEVAWGIYYLVSPGAAMVTGHNLVIDGGWTAR
jgi:2-deoxy-D-gluconate 3-dehydrogenase